MKVTSRWSLAISCVLISSSILSRPSSRFSLPARSCPCPPAAPLILVGSIPTGVPAPVWMRDLEGVRSPRRALVSQA